MYSPNKPIQVNCIPPIKHSMYIIQSQPKRYFPVIATIIVHTTPAMPNPDITTPNPNIIWSGLMLKLVIPSNANDNIFFNGMYPK